MKNILLISIFITLSGCAGMKDKFCDYKVIPAAEPIVLDQRILTPCKDLVLPEVPLTWEGILKNTKDNKLIYEDCSGKQNSSIVVIKKFSNNK